MVSEKDLELKKKLPDGVWQNEPDYHYWKDENTGLDCLIVRQPTSGHLCGYVGVPKDHSLYGIAYNDCSLPEARKPNEEEIEKYKQEQLELHVKQFKYTEERAKKSINLFLRYFTERRTCNEEWCDHRPESIFRVHGGLTYSNECHGKICHKTDDGDHVWWFGFDCAHLDDLCPGHDLFRGTYKDIDYVMGEVLDLAKQIKEYESNNI